MFILAEIFSTLALLFSMIFRILYFLLAARVIISWFPVDSYNPVINTLHQLTDPLLAPFRKIPSVGMIDLSPVFAFLALGLLDHFVVRVLMQISYRMAS